MNTPARIPAVGSRGRGARCMEAGADEATAPAALFRSRCAGLASGGGGARKCCCRRWHACGRRRPRPPSTAARTSLAVPAAPAAVRCPTLANNHSATQDRRCAGARAGAAGRQRWPSLSRRHVRFQRTPAEHRPAVRRARQAAAGISVASESIPLGGVLAVRGAERHTTRRSTSSARGSSSRWLDTRTHDARCAGERVRWPTLPSLAKHHDDVR